MVFIAQSQIPLAKNLIQVSGFAIPIGKPAHNKNANVK